MTVASRIVLAAGPLGRISHPRPNREIADWLSGFLREATSFTSQKLAITNFAANSSAPASKRVVHRLDRLKSVLNYLPINTEVMLKAAELWAGPPNTRSTSMRSRN